MWAFAIHNKVDNTIFCSRDRFGIKPFYYTIVDNKFIFGSEIKQLIHFHKNNTVNRQILLDYLIANLEDHTEETFFKGVYKLKQSNNLVYSLETNKFITEEYFTIQTDANLKKKSEEETVKELEAKLNDAIRLRLRSDVKVGTCLSGGLDSSSIAAIASKEYFKQKQERFVAIHAKSVEAKTDESHYANMVAKHCNLDMHTITPQLSDISDDIDEIVYTQEEPFGSISIFMQYYVMKEASKQGCKVMLDGQGGDETLFGYEFYYSIYLSYMLKHFKILSFIKEFKKLKTFKFTKLNIIKRIIIALSYNVRMIMYYFEKRNLNIKIDYKTKRLKPLFVIKSPAEFQKLELMYRKLPSLLKYEDKNAMRHAIETRLPFIDYKFVEKAISFDDNLKFKGGFLKYTLRKVVENLLPKEIVWRTNKFGFEAPSDMWINENKDKMIQSIEKSEILKNIINFNRKSIKNNNKLFWKLYNISAWERIYNVKY